MNKLLTFLFSLLTVSLEAAVITNWGSQLPNAVPTGSDVILMQQGGATRYFTASQLATSLSTNNALIIGPSNAIYTVVSANDTTTSNGLFSVETTRNAAVSNALVTLVASSASGIAIANGSGTNTMLFGATINAGTNATAFGDSITCGVGASPAANAYANLIGTTKGWTIINSCNSGQELADYFENIYGKVVRSNDNSFILPGYNDMRNQGTSVAALRSFRRQIYSALVWLSTVNSKIVKAQSASVVYTGAWTNTSVYGGGALGKFTSVDGATATFSIYGSVVYIDLIQFDGSTRGISVAIDGVNYGTFNGSDFVRPNTLLSYAPYLVRIPNLTETLHTVVLTVTTGTDSAYFNWAAGASGSTTEKTPSVYCGNTLRMNSTGYAAGAPDWNSGSDSAVRQYSDVIRTAVRDLSGDGLNIAYVDADAHYNLATDVDADNIHPNNTGHAHIADAFLAVMNGVAQARGRGLPDVNWSSSSENFFTTGSGYFGGIGAGVDGTNVPSAKLQIDGTNQYMLRINTNVFVIKDGAVGIGNANPANRLVVAGVSSQYSTYIYNLSAAGSSFGLLMDAGGNSSDYAMRIRDRNSTAEFMAINGLGNVALGTGTPTNRLDVTGNTSLRSNVFLGAITNVFTFGATNPPPSSAAAPTKWISVRVAGDAALYRLPLYE